MVVVAVPVGVSVIMAVSVGVSVSVSVGMSVSVRITVVARSMAYNFVDAGITRMTVVMSIGRVMSMTIT
jgi:hypothetical protein